VSVYVAPATKLLTVLHVPHPSQDGQTACGLDMEPGEVWVTVQRDCEPVCGPCQGITEEQGVLG